MPTVIINEFELVPAPTADAAGQGGVTTAALTGAAPPTPATSSQSRVQETERLLQRQTERMLRVWAH